MNIKKGQRLLPLLRKLHFALEIYRQKKVVNRKGYYYITMCRIRAKNHKQRKTKGCFRFSQNSNPK